MQVTVNRPEEGVSPREEGTLSGVAYAPFQVRIGESFFLLSQLRFADLVAAEEFIRSERLNAFLKGTRLAAGINLPDNVRAQAMGAIINHPVPLEEILSSVAGELFLIYRSLLPNMPELTFQGMLKTLDPDTIKVLGAVVFHITGLPQKGAGDTDPTETEEKTSTTETSTDGNGIVSGHD